jgi:hypothetical protein
MNTRLRSLRRWLPQDVIDWILIAIALLSLNQLLSLLP